MEKKNKYITVLDFEVGIVFQYKLKELHLNEDGVVDHEEFLTNKHKSKIRREVDLDLGVKPPKSIIFTSKKIYSRKLKHKKI